MQTFAESKLKEVESKRDRKALPIKRTEAVEVSSVTTRAPFKNDIKMKSALVLLVWVAVASATKLQEKFSWKELSFSWPDEQTKQEAIKSGSYVESHNLPLGLDVWKDKLFITVPR